ncbi:MAG: multicopper oxidase domain-containing protein [Pseudomonadota bacterium]
MALTFSRRRFLTAGTSLIGAGLVPALRAQAAPTRLPIPALADGSTGDPLDLLIKESSWSFLPGVETPTLGFSQRYLGPTLRARRGSALHLRYQNELAEAVAVHGHGLHVPGDVDGGPQLAMAPGEVWHPTLEIVQPAATCWYHSHTHGSTGSQVYRGLAGMIIIDDDESDGLDLPNRYGVDDLPVIIQDRTFDAEGRLVYSLTDAGEDGWLGETVVINGAVSPEAEVPAGLVRLRLLNGANARFYIVTFADNRTFYKIATDGGLMAAPVPLTTMEMSPGERCEILVDLSDGMPAGLLTLFEDEWDEEGEGILSGIMNLFGSSEKTLPPPALTLTPNPELTPHRAPMPQQLVTVVEPKASEIVRTRDFILDMDHDGGMAHTEHGEHVKMDMTINGAVMDMSVINERVNKGEWERWRVLSNQGVHPFHVHGCSFLIDTIEGEAAPADQRGWKDTAVLDDDGWTEFVVRFDYEATEAHPYMYHCHILEHEDRGMMGQFTVT